MAGMTLGAHPYRYPTQSRSRRHGPAGYKGYRQYRPWLEDEFLFRCVYCLKRQKWARTDTWSVDHLIPQVEAPELACDYNNLVLTCQRCNSRKLAHSVPDPVAIAYGNCLRVDDSTGEVRPLNQDGEILIRVLKLNHQDHIRTRIDTLRRVEIMARCAPDEWKRMMGFPEDLPNLRRESPPNGNSRPEGLDECWYERQQRNELPEVYE
jgi:HNH endonuclease